MWWGSKGTVTPIHHDSFPNLLAQVVGFKYVRLFAPSESSKLYPYGGGANGDSSSSSASTQQEEGQEGQEDKRGSADAAVQAGRYASQGNISRVQDPRCVDLKAFPAMADAVFEEGVLAPGDTLYIPRSHWHFVTSLTPSMSVNFWWKEHGR